MALKNLMLIQFLIYFVGAAPFAYGCERVDVDCGQMKMVIDGIESKISCGSGDRNRCGGDGLTASCQGTVGEPHNGDVVKDGVKPVNCAGMGDSGGGKVFHRGNISSHSSCGCVHVTGPDLEKLKACKTGILTIIGNGGSTQAVAKENAGDGGFSKQRVEHAKKSGENLTTETDHDEPDGETGSRSPGSENPRPSGSSMGPGKDAHGDDIPL